jgi:glycosyltransferase involved in cell wall biosynthesis
MNAAPQTRLLITTDAVGGVWTFATSLARALGAQGWEISLVTLGKSPSDPQREMVRGQPGITLRGTDLHLEWQDPSGADVPHARAILSDIARDFEPDIVHLNSYREASFTWAAPVIVTAHSCVNTWAIACGKTEAFTDASWHIYSDNVRNGLRSADTWVAPTRMFRDIMAAHYGLPPALAIWNGTAVAPHCGPKLPVVLSAGRLWDEAKNLPALLAVADSIEWPIRIAGPLPATGGDASNISEGRCTFLGEISHQATLREMQSSAIFVSAALYEPFGLSVLEAAKAGCALLLSDIPTFRELWDGAALFVSPRDPNALRRALCSLCQNETQRRWLQVAAAKRAKTYSVAATVRNYQNLYASLLNIRSDRMPARVEQVPA